MGTCPILFYTPYDPPAPFNDIHNHIFHLKITRKNEQETKGGLGGRTTFCGWGEGAYPPRSIFRMLAAGPGSPPVILGKMRKAPVRKSGWRGGDRSCVTPCDPPPTTKDLSEPLILPDQNRHRGHLTPSCVRLPLKVRAASPNAAGTLPDTCAPKKTIMR